MEGERHGDIVRAAQWLGASLIVTGAIVIGGVHRTFAYQGTPSEAARRPDSPRHEPEVARAAVVKSVPSRIESLKIDAEALRASGDDFKPFWTLDQPSHLRPFRVHEGP